MRRSAQLALFALGLLQCARSAAPVPAPTPAAPASPATPAALPQVRYLALGDSFTAGTGASPERAFPVRWSERLRARGRVVELRNLAVNGYTTQDVVQRELPQARGFDATVVTLAIGANDLVRGADEATYRARLGALFDAMTAAGLRFERVVALPQPDWSRSPVASAFGTPAELHQRIERANAALRELVEARGGRFLDLWALMERQAQAGQVASDGLHPDADAYDAWAEALAAQVTLAPEGTPTRAR